jgi:hypothetical protein
MTHLVLVKAAQRLQVSDADHPANEYPVSVMCWNDKAKELAADYHYSNFPFDRIALAPQELEGCSGEGEICPRRRMNLSHSISIT